MLPLLLLPLLLQLGPEREVIGGVLALAPAGASSDVKGLLGALPRAARRRGLLLLLLGRSDPADAPEGRPGGARGGVPGLLHHRGRGRRRRRGEDAPEAAAVLLRLLPSACSEASPDSSEHRARRSGGRRERALGPLPGPLFRQVQRLLRRLPGPSGGAGSKVRGAAGRQARRRREARPQLALALQQEARLVEDVDSPGAEEVFREAPDAEDGLGEVGGAGGELLRVCFFFFFFSGFSFPSSGVSRQRRFCVSSSSPPLLFGFSLRFLFPRKRYDAPRQQRLGRSRRPAGPRRGRGGGGAGGSSFFFGSPV